MSAMQARGLLLVSLMSAWSARAQDVPRPEPSDAYEEQFIGFDDFGAVVTDHGLVTGTVQWSVPYEGKYKKPLAGVDFYRKLGRADLLQAYQDREALRTGLTVGGAVVIVAGVIATVAIGVGQSEDCGPVTAPGFATCVDRNAHQGFDATAGAIALGVTLLGGGLVWAGAAIDPNPVGTVEARQLADAYNRELRQRLGAAPRADAVDVRLVPHLEREGAGLMLAVRF